MRKVLPMPCDCRAGSVAGPVASFARAARRPCQHTAPFINALVFLRPRRGDVNAALFSHRAGLCSHWQLVTTYSLSPSVSPSLSLSLFLFHPVPLTLSLSLSLCSHTHTYTHGVLHRIAG